MGASIKKQHKYKVTDCTGKEFVGIRITCDGNFNYYIDQTRMIESILEGIGMKNTKHEALPYPLDKISLSKADNATPQQLAECKKIPLHCRTNDVWDGAHLYDNNVLIKHAIPLRKQSWT